MAGGETILGIDLGTTKSAVAIFEDGRPKIIPNAEGDLTTPSVVCFSDAGEVCVGLPAKRQGILNPENTIYSVKRLIGRRLCDLPNDARLLPYELVGKPDEPVAIRAAGKIHSPVDIVAHILRKLRRDTEAYLGHAVSKAVISVPAYFDYSQRLATKEAARLSGLEVLRLISEPTAAAIAYRPSGQDLGPLLVADLGGGSFDVTILDVRDRVFRVVSTSGDTQLGGDDFDSAMIEQIVESFQETNDIDLRSEPQALHRLKEACERAKLELSSRLSAEVVLPCILARQGQFRDLRMPITRRQLEECIAPVVERCRLPLERALQDASVKPGEIREFVVVGEASRVPVVREWLKAFWENKYRVRPRLEEAVVLGAATYGGALAGNKGDFLLLDVTPLSLGIETIGGSITRLVERNTTIPTDRKHVFRMADDNQSAVTVRIFEGEHKMAVHNRLLGQFTLEGIPLRRRGAPQIEITLDIDANGIVNVSARDLGSDKALKVCGEEQAERAQAAYPLPIAKHGENSETDGPLARLLREDPKFLALLAIAAMALLQVLLYYGWQGALHFSNWLNRM